MFVYGMEGELSGRMQNKARLKTVARYVSL